MSLRTHLVALAVLASFVGAGPAAANLDRAGEPLSVMSTLDGQRVLPHSIPWIARPSVPAAMVKQVNFTVDGKLIWIEHKTPYKVWNTGGFITSWLKPGTHRFTTTLITTSGQQATDTVTARTIAPPPAPSSLTGIWLRAIGPAVAGAYAGTWILTIDSTGWRIQDPKHSGNYIDVAYLAANRLQLRSGMWTTPVESKGGNGWCSDTNIPVSYSWSVSGNTLTLTLTGADRCGVGKGEQHFIIGGDWTRR